MKLTSSSTQTTTTTTTTTGITKNTTQNNTSNNNSNINNCRVVSPTLIDKELYNTINTNVKRSLNKAITLNSVNNKSVGDQKAPNNTLPPIMNHVTGHYRGRNEDNPQNNVNEVEEMETQEGESAFL